MISHEADMWVWEIIRLEAEFLWKMEIYVDEDILKGVIHGNTFIFCYLNVQPIYQKKLVVGI